MTILLEFKEKLKLFYGKFDIYIVPFVKFVLAFTVFLMLGNRVGFMEKLNNPAISLILALVCALLPVNMIAVFASLLVIAHSYALSLEVFAIMTVMLMIMLLLYFRIAPGYGYLLVAAPIAFVFKVPYVIPLIMGLVATPVAAVPVACGTAVYYLLHYMRLNTTMLSGTDVENLQQKFIYLIENMIYNKEMLLMIIAFAVTLLLVYVIRRLSVDYCWYIAIIAGAIVEFLAVLIGGVFLDVSVKLLPLFFGCLAAMCIAFVLQFFLFSVDYSRTEYVQFEDDEYYYYVKAVPKMTIAVTDKKVKRIHAQKKGQAVRRNPSGNSRTATR